MNARDLFRVWACLLSGRTPSLSIEITRECPLRCPGCYAYGADHLGGSLQLRQMRDFKGQDLVDGILGLVDKHRPLHVSLVGGEPLVRFRELSILLPQLAARGIGTQVVTSAVRPIPVEWKEIRRLRISVSVDGLQPEHDARRSPATYDRILKNIAGHRITVHCTITRQMTGRPGYLREFVEFWSARPEVGRIWMSIFTPQVGESSYEILPAKVRNAVIDELHELRRNYPKLELPPRLLEVYRHPPASPDKCMFARATHCVSADLKKKITPCQFGGNPDCSQCGCMASAAMEAIGRWRLPSGIRVAQLYGLSFKIGTLIEAVRRTANTRSREAEPKIGTAQPIGGRSLFPQFAEPTGQVAEQEE